jgi:PEGA domain-containing protein
MPTPPDHVVIPDATDFEDPLGLFPSEVQKVSAEIGKVPSEIQKPSSDVLLKVPPKVQTVPPERKKSLRRANAAHTFGRPFLVLTIAWLVRVFAVLIAASRRAVHVGAASCVITASAIRKLGLLSASAIRRFRLSSWRLPAWRPPALRVRTLHVRAFRVPTLRLPALSPSMWRFSHVRLQNWHLRARRLPQWRVSGFHLPPWRLPASTLAACRARATSVGSKAHQFVTQRAARGTVSAVTLSAFACGCIAGGSAVWLSGVSRHARVESTASRQNPLDHSLGSASPIAPVGIALASTTAVGNVESKSVAAPVSARATRPSYRGSLVVSSRPSGARVFLNGRNVGQTPLVLRNQPAGSRAVRVALDGYEPWSSAVQVVANTETQLRAELKMQSPTAQP